MLNVFSSLTEYDIYHFSGEKMKKELISGKIIAAIVIGTSLMFVLNRFLFFTTEVYNIYIYPGIGILAAFAAIFGPIAGFIIGFTGHALVDHFSWDHIWWSWATASGFFGLAVGSFWKYYKTEEGGFGIKQALIFNGVQLAANILAYVFIARSLNLFMYNEAFSLLTLQGFTASGINAVVVLILGTLLLILKSKKRKLLQKF
jgi:energy-coupling factor transport system substrate-specific component